jgi:hypothetical protein
MKKYERKGWIQVVEDCGCWAMCETFKACSEHGPDTTEGPKEWSERKDRLLKSASEAQTRLVRVGATRRIMAPFEKDKEPGE